MEFCQTNQREQEKFWMKISDKMLFLFKAVIDFLECVLWKKEYASVKVNDRREHIIQKHLLLVNWKELHIEFQSKNWAIKVLWTKAKTVHFCG